MRQYILIIMLALGPVMGINGVSQAFAAEADIVELRKVDRINAAFTEAKQVKMDPGQPSASVEGTIESGPMLALNLDGFISADQQGKEMDLEFEEAPLKGFFQMIGEVTGINIVVDAAVENMKISLHLKKVTVRDAMNVIAVSRNLFFKKIGGTLFVSTREKINQGNMVTRVIPVRYIKVKEAQNMVQGLLKTVVASEDVNALAVTGTPEEIASVQELVKKIDVSQPQVILEAKIIEVNQDALKEMGVDWFDQLSVGFQESNRPSTFATTESAPGSALKVYSLARSPLQFDVALKTLENNNKAKILSNPRVMTLNNQQSEIFVGDRIPYTITTVAGGVASTEVRFVEPGIRLRITPSIIDKDFVVIKIEPEVSFIYGFRGPNDQYPWVKTRNATVYVRIKNNQPFVLGGLLNQEDKKNLYKVPVLGSVPLIGNLFSYKKDSATSSELIIVVTPVVVN
jgi:type II secretory pathway component GspD/PulD (secretin)